MLAGKAAVSYEIAAFTRKQCHRTSTPLNSFDFFCTCAKWSLSTNYSRFAQLRNMFRWTINICCALKSRKTAKKYMSNNIIEKRIKCWSDCKVSSKHSSWLFPHNQEDMSTAKWYIGVPNYHNVLLNTARETSLNTHFCAWIPRVWDHHYFRSLHGLLNKVGVNVVLTILGVFSKAANLTTWRSSRFVHVWDALLPCFVVLVSWH